MVLLALSLFPFIWMVVNKSNVSSHWVISKTETKSIIFVDDNKFVHESKKLTSDKS
jgi:hypothetical protein